jgi:hypothetical protein
MLGESALWSTASPSPLSGVSPSTRGVDPGSRRASGNVCSSNAHFIDHTSDMLVKTPVVE